MAADATHLAVHVFDREHLDVVELFGERTGDTVNKFDHCHWHSGPAQIPILDDAAAWFVGKILDDSPSATTSGTCWSRWAATRRIELEHWVSFGDVHDLQPGHEA